MAIKLKNSVFIHIPKTGGRWVKTVIEKYVGGYNHIGDPVYDAHKSPDTTLPVFAFVRHPIAMLNSLWLHRSRKHSNARHKDWNWQMDVQLERECGCDNYVQFFKNVADRPGIVESYYSHFVDKYPDVTLGRTEHLASDLISILDTFHEDYDESGILSCANTVVGKGANSVEILDKKYDRIVKKIICNEKWLAETFGYSKYNVRR